jgi:hypothetical protein
MKEKMLQQMIALYVELLLKTMSWKIEIHRSSMVKRNRMGNSARRIQI